MKPALGEVPLKMIRLTPPQTRLLHRAVERHRRGATEVDCRAHTIRPSDTLVDYDLVTISGGRFQKINVTARGLKFHDKHLNHRHLR